MIKDVFGMAPLTEILKAHMLNPQLIDGGHGVKHALQTVMIAEHLHKDMGFIGNEIAVRCAAAFHDIGRIVNRGDRLHGFRGVPGAMAAMEQICQEQQVRWTNQSTEEFRSGHPTDFLLGHPSPFRGGEWDSEWLETKGMVACIISMHCYPIMGNFTEMKIVMDADKLGRYRMGEKNWPDAERLALSLSRARMEWAKQLIQQ